MDNVISKLYQEYKYHYICTIKRLTPCYPCFHLSTDEIANSKTTTQVVGIGSEKG